jgi:hypothetical protein
MKILIDFPSQSKELEIICKGSETGTIKEAAYQVYRIINTQMSSEISKEIRRLFRENYTEKE